MKVRAKIALVILLAFLVIFVAGSVFLENIVLQLPEETIDIINKNSGVGDDWQTDLFYGKLKRINNKITIAKILAKAGSSLGYKFLLGVMKNIDYGENLENTFEKVYEALGCIGKFDKKALKLLLAEFNPKADPVRAMNVLVGIKVTRNSKALSRCISQIVPNYMSKEEVNARLQTY